MPAGVNGAVAGDSAAGAATRAAGDASTASVLSAATAVSAASAAVATSDAVGVVDSRPLAASLSPEYAALLHAPVDEAAGARVLAGPWPEWRRLIERGTACRAAAPSAPRQEVPPEWLEGESMPLLVALSALKGVGRVAAARLASRSGIADFLASHGARYEALPHGGLVARLLQDAWAGDERQRLAALAVACIMVELALHSVWRGLDLQGESCPALLRDLVLHPVLAEVLPDGLALCLKLLFLPAGLNLRNLVLHGFLAPSELPSEYCPLVVYILGALGSCVPRDVGKSASLEAPANGLWTAPREEGLPSSIVAHATSWISMGPDADAWLLEATSFVVPGREQQVALALAEYRAGRALLGAIHLLPVLEHGLRVEFCDANDKGSYGFAQFGEYYTTLDGFGQRSKHQLLLGPDVEGDANMLLPRLGLGLVHILSDMFLQDAGPAVRAAVVHGTVRGFECLYSCSPLDWPLAAVLVVFLASCGRRISTARPASHSVWSYTVTDLQDFVADYMPQYHPDSILAFALIQTLTSLQRFCALLAARQAPPAEEFPLLSASASAVHGLLVELTGPALQNACALEESPFLRLLLALLARDVASPGIPMIADLLQCAWLRQLQRPELDRVARAAPLGPCLRHLAGVVAGLADALTESAMALEEKMHNRTARTAQRRLYANTLLTGPTFAEYLLVVMLAVQRHVRDALLDGPGLAEEKITRLTRATGALALIGPAGDDRKGYDRGLREIEAFLRTRAAREALS